MAEAKTKPTQVPVAEHLAGIEDAAHRADCEARAKPMRKITGADPVMWGPGIVGFGACRYRYASGRTGEWCVTGFAARKGEISVYLAAAGPKQEALLARPGKHRMGRACLSIRRLADVDAAVLERLVADAVAEVRLRHPGA